MLKSLLSKLFLGINDKKLNHHHTIQERKLFNLAREQTECNNPNEVIFNYSKYELTELEKSLLVKGLNFSLPPKNLNHADYLVNFELLLRDIKNAGVSSSEDLDFIKTRIKDTALSSFRNYKNNAVPKNLTDEELTALHDLSTRSNLAWS